RCRRDDAAGSGLQFPLPDEGGKKNMQIARIFGYQRGPGNSGYRVGVLLKPRSPEIFRGVLLADGKTDFRCVDIAGEGDGKSEPHFAAVRLRSLAFEMERIGNRNPGRAKLGCIHGGVAAFKHQERKSFLALEKQTVEGAEQRGDRLASKLLRLNDGEQFEKAS